MTDNQKRLLATLNEILHSTCFEALFEKANAENEWFDRQSINNAVEAITQTMLNVELVENWLNGYDIQNGKRKQRVGIVMAGNIPLVGFFDLFCTLITNNRAVVKPSSKDRVLMSYIIEELARCGFEAELCQQIPQDVDKLITMGGDEAARYFAQRFGSVDCLIRAHRYSIAVLTGNESDAQLAALVNCDMFSYGGMGCRNVSRIYIPHGFDLERLPAYETTSKIFADNYRHQKAMYTMLGIEFTDGNGYILTPISDNTITPIGVIKYCYYTHLSDVCVDNAAIQCVVADIEDSILCTIPFSMSQRPSLTDYADAKDVIIFLINR